jgi:hypothetical protein
MEIPLSATVICCHTVGCYIVCRTDHKITNKENLEMFQIREHQVEVLLHGTVDRCWFGVCFG